MSMKKLVEAECGGSNPLVALSSHYVHDRGLRDEGIQHFVHSDSIRNANADQLVHEFIEETSHANAQPFRMDTLLAEMRELEGRTAPVRSASVSQLATEGDVQEWAQQYLDSGKHFDVRTGPDIWGSSSLQQFQTNSIDDVSLGLGPKWADEYLQRSQNTLLDETPTLADLSNSEEYEDKSDNLTETAGAILEIPDKDEPLSFSKFMKFMKQINEGEVKIDSEGNVTEGKNKTQNDHWSLEFEKEKTDEADWAQQFYKSEHFPDVLFDKPVDSFDNQLWEKLSKQWKSISEGGDILGEWTSDFSDFSTQFKSYSFTDDNPMKDLADPLEEGKKMLQVGDLPSAVLCFEVAAQREPQNPLAWELLGTTQAQNEQDPSAISALKRCVELQPDNLTALMALGVSYTNENFPNQACHALKEWLRINPKYSDIVPSESPIKEPFSRITSFLSREMFKEVKDLYLAAARRNPQDLDPDVQCGLGVLFNISTETDLAVDCFKAALQARPTDAALWNRLGATLANGDRSEEAVDAYRSALHLQPGFIRARYNLGITCVHLGAYREAAEHFLTALKQQSTGRGPEGATAVTNSAMSDTIWNTLRLVMSFLERFDLMNDVYQRNLEKLLEEFAVE